MSSAHIFSPANETIPVDACQLRVRDTINPMKAVGDSLPDSFGHFGVYGGVYVPETLVGALTQLEAEYAKAKSDPAFQRDLEYYLRDFVGRPSRLYFARRLTEHFGGAKIYLKREDLNHTARTRSTTPSARHC